MSTNIKGVEYYLAHPDFGLSWNLADVRGTRKYMHILANRLYNIARKLEDMANQARKNDYIRFPYFTTNNFQIATIMKLLVAR